MNSDYSELSNASFNCSGQWNYETQYPGYRYSKPPHQCAHQPRMNFYDGNMAEVSLNNPYIDSSCWDLYDEDLDYLNDDYPDSVNGELYNIEELAMWERLMFQQQELNRIKLARQLKQLQYAEEDRTFLKQLIIKQQRLRQFLNEKENRWGKNFMSIHSQAAQSFEEDEEKESWGQRSSMEQFSVEWEKESWCQRSSMEQFSVEQFSEQSRSEKSRSEKSAPQSEKNVQVKEPQQKSRHCRHFLKGHCARGESCGFRHDHSVFCTDMQKVFLGGLPTHLTASLLRKKLAEQGYTVLNHPKILRWFSPQVCLGSVQEAQKLVEKGTIVIDGAIIRVRPFEAFTRDNKKKLPDEVERSVFLGGLAVGTTAEMIKDELGKIGLVVVNIPVVKSGYSPQVALETYEQARTLLRLMRVQINGALVNVRPFANIRSSSGKKKKRNVL